MNVTLHDLSTGDLSGFGSFLIIFLLVYGLILLSIVAFSVLSYVLSAIGLQTIAKRRGIRNGWLAWLPVVNCWILGSVSDQYQYLVKGKIKNRRKQLLALEIGIAVLYVMYVLSGVAQTVIGAAVAGYEVCRYAVSVFTVILSVVQYLACFDLYRSCRPERKVVYLILSIVLPVTLPFFVFACRKYDGGMPPRRESVQPADAYPTEPVDTYPTEPVEEDFVHPEDFEEE